MGSMADKAVNAAKSAAPAIGGAFLLGPVIGGPVAGWAADKTLDSTSTSYTEAGLAVGAAGLLLGVGSGNPFAASDAKNRRGTK